MKNEKYKLHINSACGEDDKDGDLNGDTNAVDKRLSVEFEVLTHCTLPR
jgi:hypothetical protein